MNRILIGLAAGVALAAAGDARAQTCTTTVGVVMELTGPAGPFGQASSKAVELAFNDLNTAGGVLGCKLAADIRDSQSQGTVAVDVAKQLVEVRKVPVIIGGIISSVSIPILTSVTAPAGVVQVSPASSSPTLTNMGRDGKSGGWFFRTITSDALQAVVLARLAKDKGLNKLALIHVNNDFGVNSAREFTRTFQALGGVITATVPYNPDQSSYAPEVTKAMAGSPDGLFLISYPGDGTTVARGWVSQGGPQKFLLNDGMNSEAFITGVGAQYLNEAYGVSAGTVTTPSTEYFGKAYPAYAKTFDAGSPGADRSYDSAAIVGLAIAKAGKAEPAAIRDAIRQVLDPKGTTVNAGPDGFKAALGLIKDGKPINYVGVIGPVSFDPYGDITGPFREWQIKDGKVTTVGQMSADEVNQVLAKLK